MPATTSAVSYDLDREQRRSFLLLRWLLITLAAYLTLFSHLPDSLFKPACWFVALFAGSNIAYMFRSRDMFSSKPVQAALMGVDVLFVSLAFHLLRLDTTYLHFAFMAVFLIVTVWRDLKVVAFAVVGVSLLYGLYASLKLVGVLGGIPGLTAATLALDQHMEGFLTLSLFFVVSIFYLFLADQLQKHSLLSALSLEENRRTEVMAEITRSISSSVDTEEILYLIVTRLSEVFGATDCSIIRLDPKKQARVLAKATEQKVKDVCIELEDY